MSSRLTGAVQATKRQRRKNGSDPRRVSHFSLTSSATSIDDGRDKAYPFQVAEEEDEPVEVPTGYHLVDFATPTRACFAADFPTVLHRDLHERECPQGIRDEIDSLLKERQPCMQQPFYDIDSHRLMLQRILYKIATRKPLIGYRPKFAKFVGCVLALLEHEMDAFKVTMLFLQRLQLDGYFFEWKSFVDSGSEVDRHTAILDRDVKETMASIKFLWPNIYKNFEQQDCLAELSSLIRTLLGSLLVEGYQEQFQPFRCLLPLLCRILTAEVQRDDPRRYLRNVVVCVVGRHFQDFESAPDVADLKHICELISGKMPVDNALLRLIDAGQDPLNRECEIGEPTSLATALGTGAAIGSVLMTAGASAFASGIAMGIGMSAGADWGLRSGVNENAEHRRATLVDLIIKEERADPSANIQV